MGRSYSINVTIGPELGMTESALFGCKETSLRLGIPIADLISAAIITRCHSAPGKSVLFPSQWNAPSRGQHPRDMPCPADRTRSKLIVRMGGWDLWKYGL